MSVESADAVTLTDLEVIQRWSLAVRQASADRAEIVAALRADLDWLEGGHRPTVDLDDEDDGDLDEAPAPRATKRAAPRKTAAKSTGRTATTRSASTRSASTTRRRST